MLYHPDQVYLLAALALGILVPLLVYSVWYVVWGGKHAKQQRWVSSNRVGERSNHY